MNDDNDFPVLNLCGLITVQVIFVLGKLIYLPELSWWIALTPTWFTLLIFAIMTTIGAIYNRWRKP